MSVAALQLTHQSQLTIEERARAACGMAREILARDFSVPVTNRLPIVPWARANMRTEAGAHLDFDTHPYMIEVLSDPATQKGFMCGSQVGKTTMGITSAYWFADTSPVAVRVIYTMHTDKAVEAFAQTRAGQAIRASEYLLKRIGDVNNVHRKTFRRREGDSVILFAGASANRQALSEPADMLIHDEVDFSSPEVLRLYEDRLAHGYAKDKRRLVFGTPTVPGYGLARYWEESTQAEWLVKCAVCGDERPLDWPDSFAIDAEEPHFICGRGHELTWQEHIREGRWVAAQPGAAWSVYHISRAMTPYWPAARIVEAHQRETFVQLFANQVMGWPATSGELTVDEAILEACTDWDRPAADSAISTRTFLGADPGRVIHYQIGQFGPKGTHVFLRIGEAKTWEDLAAVMEVYRVRLAVVDGAYDPTKAQEFARKFKNRVWLSYYAPAEVKGEPIRRSKEYGYLNVDRTVSLDNSANRLIMGDDRFPKFADERDRAAWVSQMTAMVRGVKQAADGSIEFFWQETRPDHYRHAHNYATVAATIMAGGGDFEVHLRSPTERVTAIGPPLPQNTMEIVDTSVPSYHAQKHQQSEVPSATDAHGNSVELSRRQLRRQRMRVLPGGPL